MTSQVIPFNEPKEADPKCNFCGTPKSQSKKFISSGDGMRHICDKCIAHAKKRLEQAA